MNKKLLILMSILLILCLSPMAEARTIVQTGGVDESALFTYDVWFDDFSGVLVLTTTAVNNSGIKCVYIIVIVTCIDKSRNFRLRIHDNDDDAFIEINDESGIGSKSRKFFVDIHMDSKDLTWTAIVTDMEGIIIYAQISLFYINDPDAVWTPPGEEEEGISQKEYEAEKRRLIIRAWAWGTQILAATALALFIGVKMANRLYGAG